MKRINILSVLASILVITGSCQKFLDVNPKTQAPQDVFFNSQEGFKDALSGVYIQLKNNSIYGKHLTYGHIENLVSSWDVTAGTTEEHIGKFNFAEERVQNAFDNIYSKAYSTIANVNSILAQIDENKSVFKNKDLYNVVKGESLAIRAYLHFDMLRLFGPKPTEIDNSIKLPYVTELSKEINPLIDYNSYTSKVMKDLTEAEELLREVDPILQYSIAELRNPGPNYVFNPSDEYLAYRHYRLNIHAVKALQARINLWMGKNEQAYLAAKSVIEAKDRNGNDIFRLGIASDFASSNFILTPEHIFGLYDFSMFSKYASDFAEGNYKKGSTPTIINTQLYGNTGVDQREINLWQIRTLANQAQVNVIKKFLVAETPQNLASDYKQIPMLRLSEMYLIASETAPLAEAQEYWNKYLTARNLPISTLNSDEVLRKSDIVKEYRKEFYAEGQAFYAYKRINAARTAVLFIPANVEVNYVIPLPLSENANQQ